MANLKTYSLRLWPNGEFGIGYYRRFNPPPLAVAKTDDEIYRTSWTLSELKTLRNAVEVYGGVTPALDRMVPGYWQSVLQEILQGESCGEPGSEEVGDGGGKERSDLGLSNASKNHKRRPRGSNGLTSWGRRMVRNGCYLLEKPRQRKQVGMVTCTIPTCELSVYREIVANWNEILRVFLQWLHRRLKAGGIRFPFVVGVTEIQERRWRKEGGLPLHLHCVFQASRGRGYIVSTEDIAGAWKRSVCCNVACCENLNWNASTRVETVKKSVAQYMSKYLTKGSPEVRRSAELEGFHMPKSWWFGVGTFKRVIKRMTHYYVGDKASMVWGLCHSQESLFDYVHKVTIEREGREFVIGLAGKMPRGLRDWIVRTA